MQAAPNARFLPRLFAEVDVNFMVLLHVVKHAPLFVIVSIDYCTCFIHLFPGRGMTTRIVQEALSALQDRYGAIDAVFTDNTSYLRVSASNSI